ncbi:MULTISPECIES: RraA family protein [unclassified Arthrobacter]|uniref:RraA family protein n=1 Tax=unclassified Arthrobacter TaxID=235627 RepID=UPI001492A11C|nr:MULTISPECIES: methyltransferase [unclassified Arthrobacter]MBE0010040.1 methyltransferase [Arthrobacter sp. AET 35A]NOJ63919.1 methyltransferase [Arthrobacter sp. 147(2020)]
MNAFATVPVYVHEPLSPELRERLWALPTANIGDAMERLGVMDPAIHPVWNGARCVGTAHTVWTRAGDNMYIHEALTTVQPGDVFVVSGQADETRALIGELIGGKAKIRGAVGFVIDGAVRDAPGLEEYQMPVFARSVTAAGPYKNGPGVVGSTVAVGGVPVNPGDIIVGDADGVVVIPRVNVDRVVAAAEAKRDAEQATRDGIDAELGAQGASTKVDAPG